VKTFSQNPKDPLAEWKSNLADYGVLNIFMQYFIDHYGTKVLAGSLHSSQSGISSLNEALKKNGYSEDFSQIFTNWTIAVLINDCSAGQKYCFLNSNLKNLRILPSLTYLPTSEESTLTVTDYTKNWMGNWIKFIGGDGTLQIQFIGDEKVDFSVPYVLKDSTGSYSVGFLNLNGSERGNVYINDFGTKYESLVIVPSVHTKLSGFGEIENYYKFIWLASVANGGSVGNEELIEQLLAQVEYLRAEIARVQAQIAAILGTGASCQSFDSDLYFGMTGNEEVKCLQSFLKSQGTDIYPEGIVNGNFYSSTMQAVIRFQEKYAEQILNPLGLEEGTGYFGKKTREIANSLL
jgi:peptidoglycan hydrolase-like protein with peptidoglycan-binding domain